MTQKLWKTIWCSLEKVNIELPYDLVISLLGVFPKELKTENPGGSVG